MSLPTSFTLNTGAAIPSVAFGTCGAQDVVIYNAVLAALKAGYKHIDAAWYYQNEKPVGRAIRDSKIDRKDLFVTTKMWPTQASDPAAALEGSLSDLGLDYVDLYLMHWPFALNPDPQNKYSWGKGIIEDITFEQLWEQFQKFPKSKVKAIGVSNFTTTKLIKLLEAKTTTVVPAVNQCEFHPRLPQEKLVDFCKEKGIVCEAYSPLALGDLSNPTFQAIAEEHGVDVGQVALSWNVQRGVVVLPKSVTPARIESNIKLIKLTDSNMKELNALGANWKRLIDPSPQVGIDVYEGDIDCKQIVL